MRFAVFLLLMCAGCAQDSGQPMSTELQVVATPHVPTSHPVTLQSSDRIQAVAAVKRIGIRQYSDWTDVLHSLKLWRNERNFPQTPWTGNKLLELVLDGNRAYTHFGVPIHVANRNGVVFRTSNPAKPGLCDYHADATLEALARIATPSDTAITIGDKSFTVADAVAAAAANISWDQELAFSAIALATYLGPTTSWQNKFAETISFDEIASRLMRDWQEGSCYATHKLIALAYTLNINRESAILSKGTESDVARHLDRFATTLRRNQLPDGSWPTNWHSSNPNAKGSFTVTGHAIECLLLFPQFENKHVELIEPAVGYLIQKVLAASEVELREHAAPLTHVGSVLCDCFQISPAEIADTVENGA